MSLDELLKLNRLTNTGNLLTEEEEFLVRFFGQDYRDYRAKTSVWIPFIR